MEQEELQDPSQCPLLAAEISERKAPPPCARARLLTMSRSDERANNVVEAVMTRHSRNSRVLLMKNRSKTHKKMRLVHGCHSHKATQTAAVAGTFIFAKYQYQY